MKVLYMFLIYPICATFLAHLTHLDLIILGVNSLFLSLITGQYIKLQSREKKLLHSHIYYLYFSIKCCSLKLLCGHYTE